MSSRTIPLSLLLNSSNETGYSESTYENVDSQQLDNEEFAAQEDSEQLNQEQDYIEETSTDQETPDLGEEETFLQNVDARLAQMMQGEEENIEALNLIQRENDALREELIQRSCGRCGGYTDHDLYAYWLRQELRLERIRDLIDRIRLQRVAISRFIEMEEQEDVETVN